MNNEALGVLLMLPLLMSANISNTIESNLLNTNFSKDVIKQIKSDSKESSSTSNQN